MTLAPPPMCGLDTGPTQSTTPRRTGPAVAGTDYTATSGSLTFSRQSDHARPCTVQTELDGNAVDGSDLSFSVVLTDPGTSDAPPGPGTLQFVNSSGTGLIAGAPAGPSRFTIQTARRATTARWTSATRPR